jgi:hypothetical protein
LVTARDLRIAMMIEAASTFETLVDFYQTTRRSNPEDRSSSILQFSDYIDDKYAR